MVRLIAEWFPHWGLSVVTNVMLVSLISVDTPEASQPEPKPLALSLLQTQAPSTSGVAEEVIQPEPVKKQTKSIAKKAVEASKKQKRLERLLERKQPQKKESRLEHQTTNDQKQETPLLRGEAGTQQSNVLHQAKVRNQIPPRYPRRALKLNQEGLVILHIHIGVDGKAKEVKVAKSSGFRLLDKEAVRSVKKWDFEPEHRGGNLQAVWAKVPVRFTIR